LQLAQYAQLGAGYQTDASARVLLSLKRVIDEASEVLHPEEILTDTSPFLGGATHLAWAAADALIIPVRVGQHSVEASGLPSFSNSTEHLAEDWLCCQQMGEFSDQRL